MLASTRSAFFQQYNFDLNPHATLHTEFHRLANFRKWKQGSKSEKFEKAWMQCFGSKVLVGRNIDGRESRVTAPNGTGNGKFSSMLGSLQSLNLEGGRKKRKARVQRVGAEFASNYGTDAGVTESWQELCQDCGVNPIPPSITQCKKVQPLQRCARRDPGSHIHANVSLHIQALKGVNINIYHLLDAKKARRIAHRFRSRKELRVYMENNPDHKYPLEMAKQNKLLSVLLIECL